jgi:hypothetical protein
MPPITASGAHENRRTEPLHRSRRRRPQAGGVIVSQFLFAEIGKPRRFDPVTAYHRRAVLSARIKHLVTSRSQERMHLF